MPIIGTFVGAGSYQTSLQFSPLSFPIKPSVWLDASDESTITKDGSNLVTRWADLSGNGNDAVASGTERPTYTASSSINSLPAIQSLSNDWMTISDNATLDYSACSVFVVSNVLTGAGSFSYALWKWGASDKEFILAASDTTDGGTSRLYASSDGTVVDAGITGPAISNGDQVLLELRYTGSAVQFYVNGGFIGEDTVAGTIFNGTNDLVIFNGSGVTQEAQEIVFYSDVLTEAQSEKIRLYLLKKWGIFDTLTAPTNSVAPAVTGDTAVGDTLTATNGTWTGNPEDFSYTYQWQRNGVAIGGATSSTYDLTSSDAGASIRCVVTATTIKGATSANSNAVTADALATPTNSVAPVASGSTSVGDVLSVTNGTWTGNPASFAYAYQWQRDGVDISGATSSTYTTVSADNSTDVRCVVTATTAAGSTSANSNALSIGVSRTSSLADIIDNVHFDLAANISTSYSGSGQNFNDLSGNANHFYLGSTSGVTSDDPTFVGTADDAAAHLLFGLGDRLIMQTATTQMQALHQLNQDFSYIMTLDFPASLASFSYYFTTGVYSGGAPLVAIQGDSLSRFRLVQVANDGTTFAVSPFVSVSSSLNTGYNAILFSFNSTTGTLTIIVNDAAPVTSTITPLSPTPTNNAAFCGFGATGGSGNMSNGTELKTSALTLDQISESEWDNTILPQLNLRDGVTY